MGNRKITPFKSYETAKRGEDGKTVNEQHIRLTRSFLLSQAYNNLSKNAIKVYMAMKLIAKGEKEFNFSASLGLECLRLNENNAKSIRNAIKELVKYGFIRCIKFSNGAGHIPNRFEFSSDWINHTTKN